MLLMTARYPSLCIIRYVLAAITALNYPVHLLAQTTQNAIAALPRQSLQPDVSPDGKTLAFVWSEPGEGHWGIYKVPSAGGPPKLFSDATEEMGPALSPKWSPDGKWIAFERTGSASAAALYAKRSDGGPELFL
jgi:Tol biopolymer transport system component